MRVAVGWFQHETNTFAPSKATFDRFNQGEGWPPLQRGSDILDTFDGINIPISGFIAAMKGSRHTLVPLTWAAASPSAHVTEDAFERIGAMIVNDLKAAKPIDAVYLDLHGAMVTEHFDDGEGELLARVRAVVGEEVPIVASLDLHVNVTRKMQANATAMIAYRTYPHIDMADTGGRAAAVLKRLLDGAPRPKLASVRLPFLIPLQAQSTMMEPNSGIYRELERLEANGAVLSYATGFPAADFPECGPVVFAYADDDSIARDAADKLSNIVNEAESDYDCPVYDPGEAVRKAMSIAANASRPVIIADTQDNPGAGGNSDTTGMLRALVENHAQHAAIGLIVDREAAKIAHAVGEGAEVEISLGGKSRIPGDAPFKAQFQVERLSEGKFACTGPFYRGFQMDIGPCACLRIGGVRIVVACDKPQMAD